MRLLLVLLALVSAWTAVGAPARAADLLPGACYLTTPGGPAPPPAMLAASRFGCDSRPKGAPEGWLWLKAANPAAIGEGGEDWALLINQTRFERFAVLVTRADGSAAFLDVGEGDLRRYAMLGGYYRFDVAGSTSPPSGVYLGYEGLADAALIRKVRAVPGERADSINRTWLFLGGLFLGMVLASLVYNLFLFVGLKYRFQAWYCAWTLAVLIYGLAWSGLLQIAMPELVGSWGVRLIYFSSTVTVAFGALFFIEFIEPSALPWRLARGLRILAWAIVGVGALASLDQLGLAGPADAIINILVAAVTIGVGAGIVVAARRGSESAALYAIAWAIPLVAIAVHLLWTYRILPANDFADAGVFGSAAIQAVLLSVAIADRLGKVRIERDNATAESVRMRHLAETDPLTGLLNRRGFVMRAQLMLGRGPDKPGEGTGLILIDVDHFKSINDGFGHDVGDLVLERIGRTIEAATRDRDVSGRLGGEEFGVAVARIDRAALAELAERIRDAVAAMDASDVLGETRRLTISLGVATTEGDPDAGFERLYVAADKALYVAKHSGRNRVSLHKSAALPEGSAALAI